MTALRCLVVPRQYSKPFPCRRHHLLSAVLIISLLVVKTCRSHLHVQDSAFDSQQLFGYKDPTQIPRIEVDYGGRHPYETTEKRQLQKNDDDDDSSVESKFEPIRIVTEASSLANWVDSDEYVSIAFSILEATREVEQYLEEALSVIPVERFQFAGSPCGLPPLESPATELRDTDFLMVVKAETDTTSAICAADGSGNNTRAPLAFASPCLVDQFSRPLAGSIVFCMNIVKISMSNSAFTSRRVVYNTYLHETAHALGFSDFFFSYWTNRTTGEARTPPEQRNATPPQCLSENPFWIHNPGPNVLQPGRTLQGDLYFDIVTPTVATTVRNHFNCPTLPGGRLENLDRVTCFGNHWDNRAFHSDSMAAFAKVTGASGGLSTFTMALMEDSGFYLADFSKAEVSPYGRGRGCAFVEEDCILKGGVVPDYGVGTFCAVANETACGPFHQYIARCNLTTYEEEIDPSVFQRFPDANMGGRKRMNYCPVYEQVLWEDPKTQQKFARDCFAPLRDGVSQESIEVYGSATSRCFERANPSQTFQPKEDEKRLRPLCLQNRCDERNFVVEIILGRDVVLTCERDGDALPIPVKGYEGQTIICPRLAEICPHLVCPADCAGRGICDYDRTRPKCVCFDPRDASPMCANSPVVPMQTDNKEGECIDEANFLATPPPGEKPSKKSRGCRWIGKKKGRILKYCASPVPSYRNDILKACPEACTECGKCADDFDKVFAVTVPKAERKGSVNCEWLEESSKRAQKNYCGFVQAAQNACPLTCGLCDEDEADSASCRDDTNTTFPQFKIKKKVDCAFVAKLQTSSRRLVCKDNDDGKGNAISTVCPQTCENCPGK